MSDERSDFSDKSDRDGGGLSPLQRLRMHLSTPPSALPSLGGDDLRAPWRSDGYARLVAEGLQYAWTWQGNALPKDRR